MTIARKIAYSSLTALMFVMVVEGAARLVWAKLEADAFRQRLDAGATILRNDAINYIKDPDGDYGYVLKGNLTIEGTHINSARFHQRDEVPVALTPGALRVVCMGESTTFGNDVDSNYPSKLRNILSSEARGYKAYEVINAGVPGWTSEQVALRAELQLAQYKPMS